MQYVTEKIVATALGPASFVKPCCCAFEWPPRALEYFRVVFFLSSELESEHQPGDG